MVEKDGVKESSNVSLEERTSWLGCILFSFLSPMLKVGAKRQLEFDDLPVLRSSALCDQVEPKFDKLWADETCRPRPSLARAYFRLVAPIFWKSVPYSLLYGGGPFVQPLLLEQILLFLENPTGSGLELWHVLLMVAGLAVMNVSFFVALTQSSRYGFQMGTIVDAANISSLYRKALRLSNSSRQLETQGKIMNHISTDSQAIFDSAVYFGWLIPGFIQIPLGLGMLISRVGVATWAIFAVAFLSAVVNGSLSVLFEVLTQKKVKHTDERLKYLNDVLGGIRLVKMNGWEASFVKRIAAVRQNETRILRRYFWTMAAFMASIGFTPLLMALAVFAIYALNGNEITVSLVFVTLTLLELVREPLFMMPMMIAMLVSASVSVGRIRKFLLLPERTESPNDPSVANPVFDRKFPDVVPEHRPRVLIEGAAFRWKSPEVVKAERLEKEKQDKEQKKAAKAEQPPKGKDTVDRVSAANPEDASSATGAGSVNASGHGLTSVPIVPAAAPQAADSSQPHDPDELPATLQELNLTIADGELAMVVGPVGSGKSSVLAAVLGNIDRLSGDVAVRGRVAYVAQRAWLPSGPLRSCITGGLPLDTTRLQKAIEACVLESDLLDLPAGLDTEIGERGVTLSGGQVARVALARAVYAESDVYLLDDVLSSVDAHVGRSLFERVLDPKRGVLKNRAVLMVTNQLHYLPHAHHIVVLDDNGAVAEQGTWKDLMESGLDFAALISRHVKHGKHRMSRADSHRSAGGEDAEDESDASASSAEEAKQGPAADAAKDKGKLVDLEDRISGAVKLSVYRDLVQHSGSFGVFVVFVCFAVVSVCLRLGSNIWMAIWSDGTIITGVDVNFFIGGFALISVGGLLTQFVQELLYAQGLTTAVKNMHETLFTRVIRAPMRWFDTTPIGRIVNRFSKDVFQMDMEMPLMLSQFINNVLMMMYMIIQSTVIAYPSVVAVLPALYFYNKLQFYYRNSSREVQRLDSVTKSFVVSHFSESLTGMASILAFDRQEEFIRTNRQRLDENHRAFYTARLIARWLDIRLAWLGSIVLFATGLALVLLRDSIPPAFAGLSLSTSIGMVMFLSYFVETFTELEMKMTSVERIIEYSKIENEAQPDPSAPDVPTAWPDHGAIAFVDYSMRYRPELDLVLRDLSLSITAREKLGVVGRTGAGKSSLVMALLRICESSGGHIEIDGVNIAPMDLDRLRRAVAVIPQTPTLFEGTLRFNMDPFDEHDDDAIWGVLRAAHIANAVEKLPAKLDTVMRDGGTNFSVGQRQLLSIARALLRRTPIIFFDEATASVDMETDELIQKMVRTQFKHHTVISIAHRLNTVMDCDRILVMKDGRVGELGRPIDLLRLEGGAEPCGQGLLRQLVDETGPANAAHLREMVLKTHAGPGAESVGESGSQRQDLKSAETIPSVPAGNGVDVERIV